MEDQRADYTMAAMVIKKNKTLVTTQNSIMKLNLQPTTGNLLFTVGSKEISDLHQTY